jgi:VanZ family protein
MTFTRRRKFVLAALMLYWPAIFVLTHVPHLPKWVIKTQLGDKTPHFLAYLGLVFLWWFAISPHKRVDWFGARVWITIAAMAIYGTLDEWLQGYVGRNPDVWDFAADMAGAIAGLLLLTVFEFWAAALIVGSGVVFGATSIMRMDIVMLMPRTSPVFYLFSYALISGCWVNHLARRHNLVPGDPRWLPAALLVPLALVVIVHGYAALVVGRSHVSPVVAGLTAIITVVGTVWLVGVLRYRAAHSSPPDQNPG